MDYKYSSMRKLVFWPCFFTFLCFLSHDYFGLETKRLEAPVPTSAPVKAEKKSIFEDIFVLPELNQEPLHLEESAPPRKDNELDLGSKNTADVHTH